MLWLHERLRNQDTFILDDFIRHHGVDFPLLDDLKNCEQDPIWHGEGNVHIHTERVVNHVIELAREEGLNINEIFVLTLAAVFHDIYKPLTTKRSDEGRVIAPRHAEGGAMYLLHRLFMVTDHERESIIELVRFHHHPRQYLRDNTLSFYDIAYLTRVVPGKFLYLLCKADIMGRECPDQQELLDSLEEFRMFLEEYSCFHQSSSLNLDIQRILNDHTTSFTFLKTRHDVVNRRMLDPIVGISKYYNTPDAPTVVVMCGLSGSGKSTIASQLRDDHDMAIISPDTLRKSDSLADRKMAYRESMEILKIALRERRSVVFDATNLRRDSREKIIDLTEKYGGLTCLIENYLPLCECIRRDATRGETSVGAKVIKDQTFKSQLPDYRDYHIWGYDELISYLTK